MADPEAEARRLFAFLGEDLGPEVLDFDPADHAATERYRWFTAQRREPRAARRPPSTARGWAPAARSLDPVLRTLLRRAPWRRCCASSATWTSSAASMSGRAAAARRLPAPGPRAQRPAALRTHPGRGGAHAPGPRRHRARRRRPRRLAGGRCARPPRRLRDADVVHVQWKLADWDPRLGGLPRLEVLRALAAAAARRDHARRLPASGPLASAALADRPRAATPRRMRPPAWSSTPRMSGSAWRASCPRAARLEVVPHFVEERDRPARP